MTPFCLAVVLSLIVSIATDVSAALRPTISVSNLFTDRRSLVQKRTDSFEHLVHIFSDMDQKVVESQLMEDRIANLLKSNPILTAQTGLTILVAMNYIAERMAIVPIKFRHRLLVQTCLTILLVRILDILSALDFGNSNLLDILNDEEVIRRTSLEIKALVQTAASASLAFYLICLFTNCRAGHVLLPFILAEIPNVTRTGLLVVTAICPQEMLPLLKSGVVHDLITGSVKASSMLNAESTAKGGIDGKVPVAADEVCNEPSMAAGKLPHNDRRDQEEGNGPFVNSLFVYQNPPLDTVCSSFSYLFEMYSCTNILATLLRVKTNGEIRNFKDLIVLGAQLLVIANYIFVRSRLFLFADQARDGMGSAANVGQALMRHIAGWTGLREELVKASSVASTLRSSIPQAAAEKLQESVVPRSAPTPTKHNSRGGKGVGKDEGQDVAQREVRNNMARQQDRGIGRRIAMSESKGPTTRPHHERERKVKAEKTVKKATKRAAEKTGSKSRTASARRKAS